MRRKLIVLVLGISFFFAGYNMLPAISGIRTNVTVKHTDNHCLNSQALQDSAATGIILHECGFTYCSEDRSNRAKEVNTKANDYDDFHNQTGYEGIDNKASETVLTWDQAQKNLEEDILCWLKNSYLISNAKDIKVSISYPDTITARYFLQHAQVEFQVFLLKEESSHYYYLERNYPSELHRTQQIEAGYIWQCFSYQDYWKTEHTSVVSADDGVVCEISLDHYDDQLISDILACYKNEAAADA